MATLWTEAAIVIQHEHALMTTQATLTHAAIVDAIAGGDHLKRAVEELTDG